MQQALYMLKNVENVLLSEHTVEASEVMDLAN